MTPREALARIAALPVQEDNPETAWLDAYEVQAILADVEEPS